jgi:hypothetical protein
MTIYTADCWNVILVSASEFIKILGGEMCAIAQFISAEVNEALILLSVLVCRYILKYFCYFQVYL